ncbi:alpha/beta fold hydrolase [Parafrankia sp. EUN1f]|uniref:poly(ethylene terephthalate) hydrolase family protein n=1 Tax=Parafrankia sp. EUN1f TaxID=102897 RepID=UPI0001C44ACE|nr:alpha/beta hydrolase [Parafrankia sp. EUN1f]EFC83391.1 Triacylglycerol lipase [Parafrankia sp. EUN1f]
MRAGKLLGNARRRIRLALASATAAALCAGVVAAAPTAQADVNPYAKGPNPTEASVTATTGPFAVTTYNISSLVSGFGGGTLYYPTDTSQGTFGAIALSPGYTASWSSISWLGPRLASQGFVVIGIETNTVLDYPPSRGDQLLAALDWAVEDSPAASRIDPNRLAVGGHSMGGGGSLEAASDRPSLKAALPLAPWNTDKTWNEVGVPTLIIGGEADTVAPMSTHSTLFYNSLGGEKSLLELNNASHFFPQTANSLVAKMMISWAKRWVDNDTRYTQFLCPGPTASALGPVEEYQATCPF